MVQICNGFCLFILSMDILAVNSQTDRTKTLISKCLFTHESPCQLSLLLAQPPAKAKYSPSVRYLRGAKDATDPKYSLIPIFL